MACLCACACRPSSSAVNNPHNPDNKIKSWDELDKLRELPDFENTLLVANPFYEVLKDDAKYYAFKKIPQLKNVDGTIVDAKFTAKAAEFPDNSFPPPVK